MANLKHIEWLCDGVSSWNERRDNQEFNPDFENADLGYYLANAGFVDPDENVNLGRVNLNNANLKKVSLNRAFFGRADLSDADFQGSSLVGTSFRSAKLTNASFEKANLENAEFDHAVLVGTKFAGANLRGVNLFGARPWKATFHPTLQRCRGEREYPKVIGSTGDLLNEIGNLKNQRVEESFYFRGEPEGHWSLKPSVMRRGLFKHEGEMLRDLMSRRPADFNGMIPALAQWVLAQHHGIKTRFLDITRNPLVALFNACGTKDSESESGRIHVFAVPPALIKPFNSDTVSIIANFAKLSRYDQHVLLGKRTSPRNGESSVLSLRDYREAMQRLYQLIRQEKPYFEERIDIRDLYGVFVVEPQQFLERIRAQAGAFLVSAFHQRFEMEKISLWDKGAPVYHHYKLVIPKSCKPTLLGELRLLDITREALFPGLDVSAEAITDYYYTNLKSRRRETFSSPRPLGETEKHNDGR